MYDPLPLTPDLVGVCTTSPETGAKAIERGGFAWSTTDPRALVAHPDISAIHICTPNDSHCEAIELALAAGKHIYCDKPLALSLGEAESLAALAAAAQGIHQMTFNYRFVPALMRARELVSSGFLGDLFSFRIAYLHAGYIDPGRPYSWRTNFARSGGGAVADLGAHIIDMARYLLLPVGEDRRAGEITQVRAELQTVIKKRKEAATGLMRAVDVDDIALIQCRTAGGAIGTLEASRLSTGVQDEMRIEIHGSTGAIKFNLMNPHWLEVYDATSPEGALGGDRGGKMIEAVCRYPKPFALPIVKNTAGWLSFHTQSAFDFVQNVANFSAGISMNSASPGFPDGLAVQRVIDACIRSSGSGQWTTV